MNRLYGLIFSLIIFCISIQAFSEGYLKTSGKEIIDGGGNALVLRGMGLGGWMLQEGYMLETSDFANTQHEIKAKIEELIGKEGMEEFYNAWLQNHVKKSDIDSLKAWGFNSVRLPMHYNLFTLPIEEEPVDGENTWLDIGFDLTDSLLSWCESNEMYLILDLHAAPGGQGEDAAISDYDDSKPSLWESEGNRDKTVQLWKKLAEHYVNEEWIGGYDLINETNWNLPNNNALLLELYLEITDSIRSIDTNHIIFIEGNWWANDFTGLTPPWDDNMVYSFHKYWSYNYKSTIQWMIDIRDTYNIPIWCGETGENSNKWFTSAIELFENNNIGWAWWPLKKIGSISCPMMVPKTDDYQKLLDYWKGSGSKPTAESAKITLLEMAENLKTEKTVIHKDVVDALTRQPYEENNIPFKKLTLPGRIYAVDYDLGKQSSAYYDKEVENLQVSTGNWTGWNNGWVYRNDGVDIENCSDSESNGYNVGWIETGEWLKYTVYVEESKNYNFEFRVASQDGGGKLNMLINDVATTNTITIPQTGGWQNWQSIEMTGIYLNEGENEIKLVFETGGYNLNYFQNIGYIEAIHDKNNNNDFIVYPNPFSDQAILKFNNPNKNNYTLRILNMHGQLIKEVHNIKTDTYLLSKGDLKSGFYIISLSGQQQYNKPIIIN
ncbi:cellulase family glycosylhydrolase [Bacteroidota bacterium]